MMVVGGVVETAPVGVPATTVFANIGPAGRDTGPVRTVVTGMMETKPMSVLLILNVLGFVVMESVNATLLALAVLRTVVFVQRTADVSLGHTVGHLLCMRGGVYVRVARVLPRVLTPVTLTVTETCGAGVGATRQVAFPAAMVVNAT